MDTEAEIAATGVGQVSLLVTSVPETEAFYGGILGLEHLYTYGDLVFFSCGSTRLFLRAVPAADWVPGSIVYLQVEDIHLAHKALAAALTFVDAPHMIHKHADGTEEWMAFFPDPAGNTLALMAQVPPGAA
jgi:catechol 2,3-dioxygenase-like lactoylglutathione lyase family enzyme